MENKLSIIKEDVRELQEVIYAFENMASRQKNPIYLLIGEKLDTMANDISNELRELPEETDDGK